MRSAQDYEQVAIVDAERKTAAVQRDVQQLMLENENGHFTTRCYIISAELCCKHKEETADEQPV